MMYRQMSEIDLATSGVFTDVVEEVMDNRFVLDAMVKLSKEAKFNIIRTLADEHNIGVLRMSDAVLPYSDFMTCCDAVGIPESTARLAYLPYYNAVVERARKRIKNVIIVTQGNVYSGNIKELYPSAVNVYNWVFYPESVVKYKRYLIVTEKLAEEEDAVFAQARVCFDRFYECHPVLAKYRNKSHDAVRSRAALLGRQVLKFYNDSEASCKKILAAHTAREWDARVLNGKLWTTDIAPGDDKLYLRELQRAYPVELRDFCKTHDQLINTWYREGDVTDMLLGAPREMKFYAGPQMFTGVDFDKQSESDFVYKAKINQVHSSTHGAGEEHWKIKQVEQLKEYLTAHPEWDEYFVNDMACPHCKAIVTSEMEYCDICDFPNPNFTGIPGQDDRDHAHIRENAMGWDYSVIYDARMSAAFVDKEPDWLGTTPAYFRAESKHYVKLDPNSLKWKVVKYTNHQR